MKNVLIIYGGNSSEHQVSCQSMKFILNNIDNKKHKVECVKITKNNEWISNNKIISNIIQYLKQFDVIFPIIHGTNGEDGKLQGMLDLFNIKYVGCKCGSSYLCMDKVRTKEVLNQYNIPQIPYRIYNEYEDINFDFPVIVKPANGGSSIGINIANNKKELKKNIKIAKNYDNKIIIEKFLNVRELECAILEDKNLIVSDVGEIISANKFYDFEAKYKNQDSKTIIPADIPNEIRNNIKEFSRKIFKILELKDMARIDFFYDEKSKKIYLNEINTIPGFTEISMYPKLILNEGISYKDLFSKLIQNQK